MKTDLLQQSIIDLLEPGIFKTTAQIVEEFRIEFPGLWKKLEKEGEMLYGSSCSSVQQPATRISQCLLLLSAEQVICLRRNDGYRWSKRQHTPGSR